MSAKETTFKASQLKDLNRTMESWSFLVNGKVNVISSHIICEFCRQQEFIEIMLILNGFLQNVTSTICLGHFRKSISRVVVTGFLPFSDLPMVFPRTLGLDARH
jgi:hypothetical protein